MANSNPATRPEAAEAAGVQAAIADGQRSAWIVTGYGIFALALLSLVAYTVAQYAVQ